MSDDRRDLELLAAAAESAGAMALDWQAKGFRAWEKPDNQGPVTEADLAVDAHLKAMLMAARSDYGWLSEETADDPARLATRRIFVVDPIDGTRAFIKGRPFYSVSLAVVQEGRPRAGVILNPVTRELFTAQLGAGARLNGAPIRVSPRGVIEGARLIGSADMFRSKFWPTPWPPIDIATGNSIAYALAQVAAGTHDGSVSLTGKSDWDLAAADLLVAEAGGLATTHMGEGFLYNRSGTRHRNVVSAGPELHARLLEKLTEFNPPPDVAQTLIGGQA
ncbi:inositol monophosphatase [Zavarzinia sp.]|uniref:inositol monophosphatase family protein n=1 Tax=Zavarzinia sp. TaxID=2027920 RepID=UPI00356978EA